MQYSAVILLAILAIAAAFAPNRFSTRSSGALSAACTDKELDKNGKCPGEAGYVSFAKEAPTDFAAYKAEQAAKKAAAAGVKKNCTDKELDKNGRCPGEAGYVSFGKEAPADFAEYQRQLKAKKEAAAKGL
eukprot:gene13389-28389_t